ncbi:GNAT family N-acetyltransferase [Rouxiella sp. Mn2063]|uniref:GNAT family N-acetyltransferase n=1 Tax=Rouxiella sp. Mn2063 TaxID=3395262 RepID=UPI003BEC4E71
MESIYQDDEIEIRCALPSDALLHFAAIKDSVADIGAWQSWCTEHYSLQHSQHYLQDAVDKYLRGVEFNYCLFDRASGQIIGSVSINSMQPDSKMANVGYWIRSGFTGRSLAVTAVKAIAQFGFNQLGLTRLEIIAMESNHRSRRVAEKAGAHSEGRHRNRLYYAGKPQDAWVYSLIPGDLSE